MRRLLAVVLMFGLLDSQLWAQVPQAPANQPLLGFTAQSSAEERAWEQKFKAIPKSETHARLHAATQRASASRRLSL